MDEIVGTIDKDCYYNFYYKKFKCYLNFAIYLRK